MIVRIVKMEFIPEKVDEFFQLFSEVHNKIENYPGCVHVTLLEDISTPSVLFTYSIWDDEQSLENYRKSNFFKATWARTKMLFQSRALAWSLNELKEYGT